MSKKKDKKDKPAKPVTKPQPSEGTIQADDDPGTGFGGSNPDPNKPRPKNP